MHMKIGQMQYVRALFDGEKKCSENSHFWRQYGYTQIFEISSLLTDFRPLASFWNTTYRHLYIDFPDTTDHKISFKKKL